MKKKIALCGFIITLLRSADGFTNAAVEATIQFKNEDPNNTTPLVSTMQPYLDNFSWVDLRPEYKAVWDFSTQTKAFKDVDKITLSPGNSLTARLSYYSKHNFYGMSQYAFNYENRSPEYGCFITELRLSSLWWYNHNIVLASYRKDPEHTDDYLTCRAERISSTFFRVHMASSKNQKEEDKSLDDSKRYSVAGDAWVLDDLDFYGIDLPIELWKDQKNKISLVLPKGKTIPELLHIQSSNPPPKAENITTIELINNTTQALVAGQPWLDKFSRLSSAYYLLQPPVLQPANLAQEKDRATLAGAFEHYFAFVRLNYHIPGYAEDSGCYITTFLKNHVPSIFWAAYRFDAKHPEKNLYCFISRGDEGEDSKKITVTFYEDPSAIREIANSDFTEPYFSYSLLSSDVGGNAFYRTLPTYDHGENLEANNAGGYFEYGLRLPVDPTHEVVFEVKQHVQHYEAP